MAAPLVAIDLDVSRVVSPALPAVGVPVLCLRRLLGGSLYVPLWFVPGLQLGVLCTGTASVPWLLFLGFTLDGEATLLLRELLAPVSGWYAGWRCLHCRVAWLPPVSVWYAEWRSILCRCSSCLLFLAVTHNEEVC